MSKNDFTMNTAVHGKKADLKRMKYLIGFTIVLTGVFSLSGIMFMILGTIDSIWKEIGMATFIQQSVLYVSMSCIFISLIKMKLDNRLFSETLVKCINFIGAIFAISSFVVPRLSGYVSSGFELIAIDSFVLLDGTLLTFGLLFIILGILIKIAFETQNEMDEVL